MGKLGREGAYKTPEGKDVKWVTQAKDLEIYFSETGDWKVHIHHVRTSIMRKAGWLLRTFRNRDIKFLRFCWNTYLQPIADYCSQVWFPVSATEMDLLEGTQRVWTRQCPALRDLHPWDRRRQERFRIITI